MNDTDRKIVETLHRIDAQCCQNCAHSRHLDYLKCSIFGQDGTADIEIRSNCVCDLWEKKG